MQTCYRHPDRPTALGCSRCGTPICPSCMSDAPVGFHCPDCVRDGSRSQRRATTVVGAPVTHGPPIITFGVIALCTVILLVQMADPAVTARFGMIGSSTVTGEGVAHGQVYRLLTAALLHESLFHLLFNMLALYFVGTALEPLLGRGRFLGLYVLSAIGGSAGSMLAHPVNTLSVGASGAVFGLFGAYLVVSHRLRRDTGPVVGLIAVNAVLGFVIPRVDWQAHIGGLIVGILFALALVAAPRGQRTLVQVLAGVALLVLSLALVLVRGITL